MRRTAMLILGALLVLLFVPWLGETLFNTKGEPREAIVAVSMLQSGNWVLPVSYGSDIPYKPPLLAWLIAIFSRIFSGGEVTEFTSRLPSALAAISMIVCGYRWCLRCKGEQVAMAMAIITATSVEVLRAAVVCRVDMVLTACMCCALYGMYRWRLMRRHRLLPVIALLLSGAVLTKGPVGSLLPCLAMGIFCLLRRDKFLPTLGWLSALCLTSFILPALWYWAAYQQGGQQFLDLAWEENIGRLTGSMGYDSHINPWYYNLLTILAGMMPWTLMLVVALVAGRYSLKALRGRKLSEASVFAATVALTVLVFYCIPASKRSVYLLPMYPFMAYGVALLFVRYSSGRAVVVYSWFVAALAVIAPLVGIALEWFPISKLPVEPMPWWRYPLALAPVVGGIYAIYSRRNILLTNTYLLFLAYLAAFQPMVLNAKSDSHVVGKVVDAQKTTGPVYTLMTDSLMRYYTINFYMSDQLRPLDAATATSAEGFCVLVPADDYPALRSMVEAEPDTTILKTKSCDNRKPIVLARYNRK